jgi:hypothetical protein
MEESMFPEKYPVCRPAGMADGEGLEVQAAPVDPASVKRRLIYRPAGTIAGEELEVQAALVGQAGPESFVAAQELPGGREAGLPLEDRKPVNSGFSMPRAAG